jgi:quinol monooxygenase YgiN
VHNRSDAPDPAASPAGATVAGVTFANAGTLGALPGRRDALVAHLTQHSDALADLGCLLYEVGTNDESPDTVFVVELWTSADAHRASLESPEVRASIAAARPLLSGEFGGFRFDVAGSPLR